RSSWTLVATRTPPSPGTGSPPGPGTGTNAGASCLVPLPEPSMLGRVRGSGPGSSVFRGLTTLSGVLSVRAGTPCQQPLQQAEREQQHADRDPRPPRAEGAVEGDQGLDQAQHQHAEH